MRVMLRHCSYRTVCCDDITDIEYVVVALTENYLHYDTRVGTDASTRVTPTTASSVGLCRMMMMIMMIYVNKKLSYRRETVRQLTTWRGARPSRPLSCRPSGYTYAYGRIRNPQQTYVKRAVH